MKYSPRDYARILYKTKDVDGLLMLLKKHWVMSWLPRIIDEVKKIWDREEKIVAIKITSAYPLSSKDREAMRALVRGYIPEKEIFFSFEVEKDLIGGFSVESEELLISKNLRDSLIRLANNFY